MKKILGNKKALIGGCTIVVLLLLITGIVINNEKQYKLLASELTEVGVTNYNHDDLIVKNSTLKKMNDLLDTTTNDLNTKLADLLSQCDTLKLTCTSEGTLIDQANFAIQNLANKLNEVIATATNLKLETDSIVVSDSSYLDKINTLNTNIDNENKRLAEVQAEKEKQEQEQQQVENTPTATPTTSSSSNNNSSSSNSGSSSGNNFVCGDTLVKDQAACEKLIDDMWNPTYDYCSNPPAGYFSTEEEAYNAGYDNWDNFDKIIPGTDTFIMDPEMIGSAQCWRLIYSDNETQHSWDMFGNQID